MRIRNLSKIDIPRDLWQYLAGGLGLNSLLPQAVSDEFGVYGRNRTLRVSINKPRQVNAGRSPVKVGSYTFGHISIYPCINCNAAFLTHVYLHELHHAWLHQYYEGLYESLHSCEMEEEFSDHAFGLLRGSIDGAKKCADYELKPNMALARMEQYGDYVQRHTRRVAELAGEVTPDLAKENQDAHY